MTLPRRAFLFALPAAAAVASFGLPTAALARTLKSIPKTASP